jgi:hypothetical protein
MRKSILVAAVFSVFAISTAMAQPKPGQYTGPKQCKASANGVEVDVSSKRTIGVATCKNAAQKELIAKGACKDVTGKNRRIEYTWAFGKDDDANQAKGTDKMSCPK